MKPIDIQGDESVYINMLMMAVGWWDEASY
jgi:hypothetical protein